MVQGLFHVPHFLSTEEIAALIEFARKVCAEAPLRRPSMPDGTPLKLTLTNAGFFGWWADRNGYQYRMKHPTTNKPWPKIPMPIQMLADRALAKCGLLPQEIENCLINHYAPGESLGLHMDKTEDDLSAPIVSLSIGADAEFHMGGPTREDRTEKICLQSGDLVVQSGKSRKYYHGVRRIFPTLGNPLKDGGRLNFTLRKVSMYGTVRTPVEELEPDPSRPAQCIAGCGVLTMDGVCHGCAQKAHGA